MITKKILHWYRQNKRNLPWRLTKDPYKIWLSEIILQQTRVDQGLEYYNQFVNKFDDVYKLAQASEDEVLRLWQGLGYYSRARNLHFAAKQVVIDFGGKFPKSKRELLSLKGVGDYTASAIASIAFNQPEAVVDGNVLRFVSRLYAIEEPIDKVAGKNKIKYYVEKLINHKNPGEFNQAIMEFGALYCKPSKPDCGNCIFKDNCLAYEKRLVEQLPIKSSKVKQKERFFYYLVIKDRNEELLLLKRTANDIWKGLYEFPLIESDSTRSIDSLIHCEKFIRILSKKFIIQKVSKIYNHQLSHQKIKGQFIVIKVDMFKDGNEFLRVKKNEIDNFAIPRLISRFLEEYDV